MPKPLPTTSIQPLSGVAIVVTRPRQQAVRLRDRLAELGAEVLVQPAIAVVPTDDWSKVDDAIARLDEFDWLVFSSTNGVDFLLRRIRLLDSGNDIANKLANIKLAAIGPGTAKALGKFHLQADLVPREYRAENLADELAEMLSQRAGSMRFLSVRASRGRPVLRERLVAAGGIVEEIVVYTSRDISADAPGVKRIAAKLADGRIDWITVTSSAIARSLARMFGENLRRAKLASISPITSAVLVELGFEPAVEATEYTIDAIGQAILEKELDLLSKRGPTQIAKNGGKDDKADAHRRIGPLEGDSSGQIEGEYQE